MASTKKKQDPGRSLEEELREEPPAAPARPSVVVTSWDDADQQLLEIAKLQFEADALQAKANARKAKIDSETTPRLKDLLSRKVVIEAAVLTFAESKGNEIARGSKKELTYGAITKSPKSMYVNVLTSLEKIAKKLLLSPKWRGLVKKPEPTVTKTDLKKIPAADRKQYGFQVLETDPTYSIELNENNVRSFLSTGKRS